jgi:hypothetical protein
VLWKRRLIVVSDDFELFSRSSKIFRKNIQPSCSSRCASP